MKRLIALSTLLFIIVLAALAPTATGLTPGRSTTPSASTCREPLVQNRTLCADLEAQILSSTVRVYFETWVMAPDESGYLMYDSVGHATVKDGRYLVTHNHTEIPLSIRHREGDPESFTQVSLYDTAGELRYEGPLADFSIVVVDTETLVFAHKEDGFFESLGFTSAQFKSWGELPLAVGMEMAQVDWDGERARVDWVPISDLSVESDVPRIGLEDGAMVGASGGGIFWGGYHIANNWRVEEKLDSGGNVIGQTTIAAVNSPLVAAIGD